MGFLRRTEKFSLFLNGSADEGNEKHWTNEVAGLNVLGNDCSGTSFGPTVVRSVQLLYCPRPVWRVRGWALWPGKLPISAVLLDAYFVVLFQVCEV